MIGGEKCSSTRPERTLSCWRSKPLCRLGQAWLYSGQTRAPSSCLLMDRTKQMASISKDVRERCRAKRLCERRPLPYSALLLPRSWLHNSISPEETKICHPNIFPKSPLRRFQRLRPVVSCRRMWAQDTASVGYRDRRVHSSSRESPCPWNPQIGAWQY